MNTNIKMENVNYTSEGSENYDVVVNNLDTNVKIAANHLSLDKNSAVNKRYILQCNEFFKRCVLLFGIIQLVTIIIGIVLLVFFSTGCYKYNQNVQEVLIAEFERCPGSNWIEYKDSKCFKLVNSFVRFSEASDACNRESSGNYISKPATIKSSDEQQFLNNYVFNDSAIRTSVWIGLSKKDERFQWIDGTNPKFTNWPAEHPSSQIDNQCVEMVSKHSKFENGQWIDTSCSNGNFVLCEKLQVWSVYEAEMALLQMRDEAEMALLQLRDESFHRVSQINAELKSKTNTLNNIEQKIIKINANPVPIGFIYVQLKDQRDPALIWPMVTWTEISSNYAGLFFRVVGGNSSNFGKLQGYNSPRLLKVERDFWNEDSASTVNIKPGEWSQSVHTGVSGQYSNNNMLTRFFVSDVETRPYNTAMKIWKRTA